MFKQTIENQAFGLIAWNIKKIYVVLIDQGCLQFVECLGREGVGIGQYNLLSSIFH